MEKVKFTTTINSELLEKIKIQAIKEKCSVSSLLEKLMSQYLESVGQNTKECNGK